MSLEQVRETKLTTIALDREGLHADLSVFFTAFHSSAGITERFEEAVIFLCAWMKQAVLPRW